MTNLERMAKMLVLIGEVCELADQVNPDETLESEIDQLRCVLDTAFNDARELLKYEAEKR